MIKIVNGIVAAVVAVVDVRLIAIGEILQVYSMTDEIIIYLGINKDYNNN